MDNEDLSTNKTDKRIELDVPLIIPFSIIVFYDKISQFWKETRKNRSARGISIHKMNAPVLHSDDGRVSNKSMNTGRHYSRQILNIQYLHLPASPDWEFWKKHCFSHLRNWPLQAMNFPDPQEKVRKVHIAHKRSEVSTWQKYSSITEQYLHILLSIRNKNIEISPTQLKKHKYINILSIIYVLSK